MKIRAVLLFTSVSSISEPSGEISTVPNMKKIEWTVQSPNGTQSQITYAVIAEPELAITSKPIIFYPPRPAAAPNIVISRPKASNTTKAAFARTAVIKLEDIATVKA